jgi:hypothetical protein
VSGYQTVLKSAGIPPRVFDRLKNRSGYSHRFPHGDSRNPVVYVHRVEELAGARWHVLGCIRDAGSDHTGRSNFLAHMLAIEAAEARGKPGGPAAAASARGCFLDKWDAPPEPAAAAKTLVAADRPPRAGDAPAWTASGLDPGLAGDLAAAAMANGRILLVTRPGDDVLALFADAMRLVEPSKRWGVTFNTCAIEEFDGTWKAIRSDLAGPGDLRDGKAVLIDLTTNPRGSTGPYAQFARGDIESLPWQAVAKVAEPERDAAANDSSPTPGTALGERYPGKGPTGGKTGKGRPKSGDHKIGRRETRRRYEEEEPSGIPWHTLALAGMGLVVLALLLAIPFRDRLVALVQPQPPRPIEPLAEPGAEPSKPPPVDAKDTPEYRTATKIKEARDRLQAGDNGVTHDTLRESAAELLEQLKVLQNIYQVEWPKISAKDGSDRDPVGGIAAAIQTAIGQCDAVAMVLPADSGAKLQDLEQAEKDFKAAASGFAELTKQVAELENAANAERNRQTALRTANDLRARRQKAFQDFQSLGRTEKLPAAATSGGADLDDRPVSSASRGKAAEINLGPFQAADLVDKKFGIAVPKDTIDGSDFKLRVVDVGPPSGLHWEIQYLSPGVGVDGKDENVKPRILATLVARDGRLMLEVLKSNELNQAPFALLRRSVILAEAKDPAAPDAPAVVQEIRLVKPTKVRPLVIDLFAEHRQELKIVPPPGIPRTVKADGSNPTLAIPIESLRLDAELPGGQKVSYEIPKDVEEGSDPRIRTWKSPLAQLNPDLAIEADIQLSLPQATLAVETRLTGNKAGGFKKEKIKEFFIDKPDDVFKNFERGFRSRVKQGEDFTFSQARKPQGNKDILGWFGRPLVNEDMGMPGHQTVAKSFDLFLKQRYDEAAKGMKDGKRPDLPENTAQFYERCQRVQDDAAWKSVFTNRVSDWAYNWFWPKFADQWAANVKLFQGAMAQRQEIRITAITSLAYDETGKVYEVPLVVLEETPAAPAGAGPTAPAGPAVGLE